MSEVGILVLRSMDVKVCERQSICHDMKARDDLKDIATKNLVILVFLLLRYIPLGISWYKVIETINSVKKGDGF